MRRGLFCCGLCCLLSCLLSCLLMVSAAEAGPKAKAKAADVPVRACIDASTGLPAYRWGRRGRAFAYGHGTGVSQHGAFQLAASAGRALRVRQSAKEDWARGGARTDARRRPTR